MDRLFVSIADFSDPRLGGGDSFCDRLNNRYTVYVLVLFSALITTKVILRDVDTFCSQCFVEIIGHTRMAENRQDLTK